MVVMVNLWNLIQFQFGWFALVLGVASGQVALGLVAMAVLALLHVYQSRKRLQEATLLAAIALVGWCWESLLTGTGMLAYPDHEGLLAPAWMMALWVNFATTLNFSLAWLQPRLGLSALLGGIGGPLAFISGQALGAVQLIGGGMAIVALAVGWALLTPMVMTLARQWPQWFDSGEPLSYPGKGVCSARE
jgi:hypothetical protein